MFFHTVAKPVQPWEVLIYPMTSNINHWRSFQNCCSLHKFLVINFWTRSIDLTDNVYHQIIFIIDKSSDMFCFGRLIFGKTLYVATMSLVSFSGWNSIEQRRGTMNWHISEVVSMWNGFGMNFQCSGLSNVTWNIE